MRVSAPYRVHPPPQRRADSTRRLVSHGNGQGDRWVPRASHQSAQAIHRPAEPRVSTRCPRRDEGPSTARVPRIIFRSSSGSRFPRAVERGAGCGGAAPARPSASECGAAEESAASRRPRAGCAVARRRCRFNGPLRAAPRHKAGRPGGQGAERRSRGSGPAPQRHTVGWLRL